jgi:hypothetical protein
MFVLLSPRTPAEIPLAPARPVPSLPNTPEVLSADDEFSPRTPANPVAVRPCTPIADLLSPRTPAGTDPLWPDVPVPSIPRTPAESTATDVVEPLIPANPVVVPSTATPPLAFP